MDIDALRLRHLWFYLDNDKVWNPLAKMFFPKASSLERLKLESIKRRNLNERQLGCHQAIARIHKTRKVMRENNI